MDRSEVKKFSLILGVGGGFSATKTKVARNWLKWIDLKSKIFPHPGGGGAFLPQKPKRGSMMHEILVCEVMSCAMIRAEYLTKRQKRGGEGFSAILHQVEVLPVEYSSLS